MGVIAIQRRVGECLKVECGSKWTALFTACGIMFKSIQFSFYNRQADRHKPNVSKLLQGSGFGISTAEVSSSLKGHDLLYCISFRSGCKHWMQLPFAPRTPSHLLHDCDCRNRLQAPGDLSLMNETPRFKWVRKGGACAAFICKWFRLGVVRYSSKSYLCL